MKKVILGIVMLVSMLLTSCERDIISHTIKFKVIDTTDVIYYQTSVYYDVIIKIDSSYYSAKINSKGELNKIVRKLNNIK